MGDLPSIRWGIVTTGLISSWFVEDLNLERSDAKVKHIVQCIGSSSKKKAEEFVSRYCPNLSPTLYDSYEAVYEDPDVDVVYIGTPHAFHKKNCLDAIAAGKNVLCEKAFTLNAKEAQEVFDAAKRKGVYVHEAMWLRHRPLVLELRRLLFEDKVIGEVIRTFCDFGLDIDIKNLPSSSRYKDINLGAGTMLDIGIYALTWTILTLDPRSPQNSQRPTIKATQTHHDGIEVLTSAVLDYPETGRQGVVSSTTLGYGEANVAARIYGSKGYIVVEGPFPSVPLSFTVFPSPQVDLDSNQVVSREGKKYEFPRVGRGLIYEADNTALNILAGKKESDIMPWKETIRVMEIMDEIRHQGGTKYPAD